MNKKNNKMLIKKQVITLIKFLWYTVHIKTWSIPGDPSGKK